MVYIHIPFCRSFCTYCGFYSELYSRKDGRNVAEAFAGALERELSSRTDELSGTPDTLYIGGGTPSVLPLSVLSGIAGLFSSGSFHVFEEFTLEVNPEDVLMGGPAWVESLLQMGVNRFSMGIQSFDDNVLKWMNRRHDSAGAVKAYRVLRQAGADNVSIDLIFGTGRMVSDRTNASARTLSGLSWPEFPESWKTTVESALDLPGGPPEHISAYQLSVEPGSALEKLIARGRFAEAEDEACALQYDYLCSALKSAGYRHYEVSNFSKPGREAIHNSAYWAGKPYLGLGPGAHSYRIADGRHIRSWNHSSVQEYMKGNYREGSEVLTPEDIATERIMLSLRTDCGLPEKELAILSAPETVRTMLSNGNLEHLPDGNLRIPESRFFISDSIIAELV